MLEDARRFYEILRDARRFWKILGDTNSHPTIGDTSSPPTMESSEQGSISRTDCSTTGRVKAVSRALPAHSSHGQRSFDTGLARG